jgi:hypothetical protein
MATDVGSDYAVDERKVAYWERVRRVEAAISKYDWRITDDPRRQAILFIEMLAAAFSVPFEVGVEQTANIQAP